VQQWESCRCKEQVLRWQRFYREQRRGKRDLDHHSQLTKHHRDLFNRTPKQAFEQEVQSLRLRIKELREIVIGLQAILPPWQAMAYAERAAVEAALDGADQPVKRPC
jgi:hypothetical protein